MKLLDEMNAYEPWNPQEKLDKMKLIQYLMNEKDLYTRDNEHVHITASTWIINAVNDKVLMIHHNIYKSWGWCGGHADGDEDLLHVACKEGKEETGITNLYPYDKTIFAIDILPVPEHMKHGCIVKEHLHMNFTYLCIADENDLLQIRPDENSGVMWIDTSAINDYVNEEDMKPLYQKLIEKTEVMYKHK